jgi:hypothetical protein
MSYDPFVRGPAPVGVRTLALTDRARDDRPLPGLGVAHMDAALRAHEGAAQLLEGDVRGALAERGVRIAVY